MTSGRTRTTSTGALWLLPLLPVAALVYGLCSAEVRAPRGEGSAETRTEVARRVRNREASLRRQALEKFPADPWSQNDDFANAERRLVRQLAERFDMRPGAALGAIDADVKQDSDAAELSGFGRGQVPPCTPRVFYF